MGSGSPQIRPQLDERRAGDLLEGWKAIADHLGKTERTVQRWEKNKGLPVRRLRAESAEEQPRVCAYRTELDAWWARQTELDDDKSDPVGTISDLQPVPKGPDSDEPVEKHEKGQKRSLGWIVLGALAALFLAGLCIQFWPQIRDRFWPGGKVVLAVRPFKNLSGDAGQDYIAEGLTAEMVTRLGQMHPQKMAVVPLTVAYGNVTSGRLRKDLQADYVLEGSVRRVGDQVAITAQLLQTSDQAVVLGKSYVGDVKDILRIQREVAGEIAREVLNKLPHDTSPTRQVDREAYLAYLEGRYFWNKRTAEGFAKAIALFQRSIDIDPTYAPPYAGLADCYELLGSAPYSALPPQDAFPKSEEAARKALQLDDTLAEAHVSLGYSELVFERNVPEAEKEFLRALALRPDYATGHQFYGYYLTAVGRLDEAIAERKKAVELDPLSPLLTSALGEAYYQAREFDQTIEQNTRALELDSSYVIGLVNLGRAYQQKGMHREARAAFQKILAMSPDNPAVLALLGHEYARSGDKVEANQVIAKLVNISRQRYVPSLYVALVYTGLGDKEHAFQWLEKAYAERCEYLVYLPTEPTADPLRSDPRFNNLLKRLGLAPVGL